MEADHPAIGGRLIRSLRVESGGDRHRVVDDPEPGDLVGHGTACAGIIHAIAPAAALVSIRVLGPDNRGAGPAFAAALEWAIGERFGVVNLSLSSRSEAMAERFHELADEAYFANTLLVAAANNVIGPSYPSLFAAVVSVAAHDIPDPDVWLYNPAPPVEFGAHGLDVDVAWRGGTPDPRDRQLVRRAAPCRSGGARSAPRTPTPVRSRSRRCSRRPPTTPGHDDTARVGRAVSSVTGCVGRVRPCRSSSAGSSVGMASPP